jgi:L-lactate dehydrogenase complex protein LldF
MYICRKHSGMEDKYNKFLKDSKNKSFDPKHRKTLAFNINRYDNAVKQGALNYANLEIARDRAAWIKRSALNRWSELLIEFEENAINNGAEVRWATDAEEAMQHVKSIFEKHNIKLVVKGKSMVTEELHFNHVVEEWGVEALETDLGEFIVQVAGEKPYHILTPAMHKSKEDVAELFHSTFGTDENATPQELTKYVRKLLREKFIAADAGITGANFLIADTGSVALTENEGNILLSASMPKTHIVIAGIEKIIPSIDHLATLWPLLAHKGTGQQITAYNSLFQGPRKQNETDGPEQMYIILLDNGRTNILTSDEQKDALACIRCGACLNACPVYRLVGGYTYDTTYTGPIGSIISPFYNGFEKYKHLSHACSLCEKCGDVCPVKIDLPHLLLANRRDGVEQGFVTTAEKLMMSGLKVMLSDRKKMDFFPAFVKNSGGSLFGSPLWGTNRDMPVFEKKSFSKMWKEQQEKKK